MVSVWYSKFRTITVGDARLKVIARNEAEEAAKERIAFKKAESQRKKEEYRAGVESRKLERLVKKAEKEAEKEAHLAELAWLLEMGEKPPRRRRKRPIEPENEAEI
jgi:hypothetical protein